MVYNIDNENERVIFRRLSPDDKMEALYEILAHSRKERDEKLENISGSIQDVKASQATLRRNQIKSDEKIDDLEKDLKRYRTTREKREKKLADLLDTAPEVKDMTPGQKETFTEKVRAIASKQNSEWISLVKWLVQIILIILGIKYGNNLLPP